MVESEGDDGDPTAGEGSGGIVGPLSGRGLFRAGAVLGRRAEVAAQARPDSRARPARVTITSVSGRSRAVLFRAILGPAHRAWPMGPGPSGHLYTWPWTAGGSRAH
jgi:hypothetical protein